MIGPFKLTYQSAYNCVGREMPGARALQDFLLTEIGRLEGCETIDSGIYNCRNIGGTGRKSTHSEGRAGDTGVRLPGGLWPRHKIVEPGIDEWCDRLIDNAAKLGVQYIIYARRSRKPGEGWKVYNGQSPHFDHIHWELTREAANTITAEHIRSVLKPAEGAAMTITEYLNWKYWSHNGQKRQPDQDGFMFWLGVFADEKGSAVWGKADFEASEATRQLVWGFDNP